MKLSVVFFSLFLIIIAQLCFAQKDNEVKNEFVKVYKTHFYLVPPFPSDIVEISNYQICSRTELPPRQNADKDFLDLYDMTDQTPVYSQMDTCDFESIVKFVMTSGLLDINMNYTKPKSENEIVWITVGGPNVNYVIETTKKGKLDLLVTGGENFDLPLLLKQFNEMFQKIEEKYKLKKD